MALPLLPLLSLGTSLLGGLMGNQTNTTQNTNGTAATTTAQNVNSVNQGASTTNNMGMDSRAITRLDAPTTKNLTGRVNAGIDSGESASALRMKRAGELGSAKNFDVDTFVNGIVQGATADANQGLESNINALESGIGATGKKNSAAALLENKMRTSTAASLAATKSEAVAQGENIRLTGQDSRTNQISTLLGQEDSATTNLLNSLLSAKENQAGTNNVLQNTNTTESQIQNTTQTGAEITQSGTQQNTGQHNWQDLLKGLFSAQF